MVKDFEWFTFKEVWVIVLFIIVCILMYSSFFIVDVWHVWIVKTFWNLNKEVYDPWFHLKNPMSSSYDFDIKNKKVEWTSESASKDLQVVNTSVTLNYSVIKGKVIQIYSNVWDISSIESILICPSLSESVKASTSLFNASDLIVKRDLVKQKIEESLKSRLSSYGIFINQVSITNFSFSPEFDKIVEEKVTAEQHALSEKNKLETVKFQAQQQIEQSKAEAEKIKIQAEAITKQWWSEYVKLQWIQKWNWQLPTTTLSDTSTLFYWVK